MAGRKINLFLDEDLITEGKILAAKENRSLSKIVTELLTKYIKMKDEKENLEK